MLVIFSLIGSAINGQNSNYKIAQTIDLGNFVSGISMENAFEKAGATTQTFYNFFKDSSFTLAKKSEKCTLAFVSMKDLGFSKNTRVTEVYSKIVGDTVTVAGEVYVVDYCPAEVGPQFLLQYDRKIFTDSFYFAIAMKPMCPENDLSPKIFAVEKFSKNDKYNKGVVLYAYNLYDYYDRFPPSENFGKQREFFVRSYENVLVRLNKVIPQETGKL